MKGTLARISWHVTAKARARCATTSLCSIVVLNGLSSTPPRADLRPPRTDAPRTHFRSPRAKKCGLTYTAIVVVALTAAVLSAAPKKFSDPALPKASEPDDRAAAKLKPNPLGTFRKAPKPLSKDAETTDWADFLGPAHKPISAETKILQSFGKNGPALVWEMAKGTGYSSPAIQGDYLVYLHRQSSQEVVEALHPETGKRYWRHLYATDFEDRYGYNNGPRASPVIARERVYTYGAQGVLHCLNLATGQVLWRRDIAKEFKVPQDFFGVASTPLVEGDKLIVSVGAPGGPTVAAFDLENGRMLWGAGEEWGPGYGSPIPATVHGNRRVFVLAGGESNPPSGGLLVIDPADGSLDFSFPWRSRSYESVNASSPVIVGDRVLVSATYRAGAAYLEMDSDGGYSELWQNKDFDLHWTTPIYKDGYFYAFSGRNEPDAKLTCVGAAGGKTVWSEALEWDETIDVGGEPRKLSASPLRGNLLLVEGKFLALGEHGHLLWLDLSPQGPKILERTRLFLARESWSPPVLSRGLLYVNQNSRGMAPRTGSRLLCYDLRRP